MPVNCNEEFTPKRADAKFCSDKCRARFNRTDKRTDLNVQQDNRTDNSEPVVRFFTDSTGKQHKINFTERRKNKALLQKWAKQDDKQGILGRLSMKYDIVRGYYDENEKITTKGLHYLGYV